MDNQQPNNNSNASTRYIFELQNKKLPKFPVTLTTDSRFSSAAWENPFLNEVVQTDAIKAGVEKTLKVAEVNQQNWKKEGFGPSDPRWPNSGEDVQVQDKLAKNGCTTGVQVKGVDGADVQVTVTHDTIAESAVELDKNYCLTTQKPLIVKSCGGSELILTPRHKEPLGEPSNDGTVFTPLHVADASTGIQLEYGDPTAQGCTPQAADEPPPNEVGIVGPSHVHQIDHTTSVWTNQQVFGYPQPQHRAHGRPIGHTGDNPTGCSPGDVSTGPGSNTPGGLTSSSRMIRQSVVEQDQSRRNSDESMEDGGGSSEDDSDDSVFAAHGSLAALSSNTLVKELMNQLNFTELENYLLHFEHAYQVCEKVRGAETCQIFNECAGPETKEYVDREVESVRAGQFPLGENQQNVLYTLFHHAMNCRFTGVCGLPLCLEFRSAMDEVQRKEGANFQHWSSTTRTTELMTVLYSGTSHFLNESDHRVREDQDFCFAYERYLNSGSFGHVFDTWLFTVRGGQCRVAVKKSGGHFGGDPRLTAKVGDIARLASDLRGAPNLLLPDVVLVGPSGINYLLMEKGEISLLAYAKQKYEAHKAVCANQSLRSHYQCNEPAVPLNLTCWYLYQMSLGLKYLHDNGYTHGDIKPDNVLLMRGLRELKICDFDSVKKKEEKMAFGTHGYMAPEVTDQSVNNVLPESDIYSFCCCIPEILTGYPMKNKLTESQYKLRTQTLQSLVEGKDRLLGAIFQHGMRWNHTERPPIDRIVGCFQRNREIRERISNIDFSQVASVVSTNPNMPMLGRTLVDKWMDESLNGLPQSLPPFHPPSEGMEMEDAQPMNNEDVSVEALLSGE